MAEPTHREKYVAPVALALRVYYGALALLHPRKPITGQITVS